MNHLTDNEALTIIDTALVRRDEFAAYVAEHYSTKLAAMIAGQDFSLFMPKEVSDAFDAWSRDQDAAS